MSFDIHRFLEEIVKRDLTDLAMKNPYFGAGIISGGVEFLGACLDTHPIEEEGKSASRFCLAVNELFPASYHSFSRPAPYTKANKPTHDLYSSLRCGMAHVLRPQGVFLTGTILEATNDGNVHLDILERGGKKYLMIIVEQFVEDFRAAVTELQKRLTSGTLPLKLQGNIITVWPS